MTIRARSSILVTVLCLAGLVLGILATRGVYERAYADAAAAVASSPPVAPTIDDAWSLAQTGQWSALALVFLVGAFSTINRIADRRQSEALGRFSPLLAGAAAIVATMVVFFAFQHWIDVRALGTVAGAVALAVIRMPGHRIPVKDAANALFAKVKGLPYDPPPVTVTGIATSPTATSGPTTRPPEAGCARLHLMITLGLIATAALLASVACTSPTVRSARHAAAQTIVDCGRAEVADLASDLVPAVTAIVTGDTPSWRAQLDALLSAGTHAGACAIRAVAGDLARKAEQLVTGAHAEGQERIGAANARAYLEARGFVFAVPR